MPRTKQRKVKAQAPPYEQVMRDFNRLVKLNIQKKDIEMKDAMSSFETTFDTIISRFPIEIQNMTLGELVTIQKSPKKENIPPSKTPKTIGTANKSLAKQMNSRNASTISKRTTATSDDGYQSEAALSQASKILSNQTRATRPTRSSTQESGKRERSVSRNGKSKLPPSTVRSSSQDTVKRERSVSRDRNSKLVTSNIVNSSQKKTKKDLMKTPTSKQPQNSFVITPKIKLNSAMNVLRKPKDGEMVFSTSGSPLLVSTTVNDRTANINVPLRNGNVVSLLPFHETSLTDDNLYLDEETRNQLQILQSHLSKVLDK